MYKKAEFLNNLFNQYAHEKAFPGIYTSGNYRDYLIEAGQPCAVLVPEIDTASYRDNIGDANKLLYAMGWSKEKKGIVTLEAVEKSGLSDREIWQRLVEYWGIIGCSNIQSVFPFYQHKGKNDGAISILRMRSNSFSVNFRKKFFSEDPTGLVKIVSSFEEAKKIDVAAKLKKNRYLCFVIEGMAEKSVVEKSYHEINSLISNLRNKYPYNRAHSTKDANKTTPFLLNTISICFHQLADIMPVFDARAVKKSFGMEILLTNSELTPNQIHGGVGSVSFTLLFSASADNIFEIDGDEIIKESGLTVPDVMSMIDTTISNSASQRHTKSNKKSKSSGMEEKVCAA